MSGRAMRITAALREAGSSGRPALSAFVTGGYPSRDAFPRLLGAAARAADVVEVGVPFSDPMADGVTIQRASRVALAGGTTLAWILRTLAQARARLAAPVALMSYVNPLLAYGLGRLAADAAASGVSALIVPDLPLEEQGPLADALAARGVGLVQLVTPTTPPGRSARLARLSDGFVYAVAVRGTTGGGLGPREDLRAYLEAIRREARTPVLAGFGVRTPADVAAIAPPADGVVVGSALLEAVERGEDPERFLESLRSARAEAAG